jgi:hypothetical protein
LQHGKHLKLCEGFVMHTLTLRVFIATTLALLLAAPALANTQAWNYVSYKKDPASGRYSKDLNNVGSLELTEKDGQASFRIIAGTLDLCHRGSIAANVERTAQTLTITTAQAYAGCPLYRYIIRTDGSGGRKEFQRDGVWIDDRLDHDLRPKP